MTIVMFEGKKTPKKQTPNLHFQRQSNRVAERIKRKLNDRPPGIRCEYGSHELFLDTDVFFLTGHILSWFYFIRGFEFPLECSTAYSRYFVTRVKF